MLGMAIILSMGLPSPNTSQEVTTISYVYYPHCGEGNSAGIKQENHGYGMNELSNKCTGPCLIIGKSYFLITQPKKHPVS